MTASTFDEARSRAQAARRKAKEVRNEWKGRPPTADRDGAFKAALSEITQSIDGLRRWEHEDSAYRRDAKREIGDSFGVQGGTYRDAGEFEDAVRAYDNGFPYEDFVNSQGGVPSSYCLVQRLVTRVLVDPAGFATAKPVIDLVVQPALARCVDIVEAQIRGPRKNDSWAGADLGVLLQLMTVGQDGRRHASRAVVAWDALEDMNPDRFVLHSTREVLTALRDRLAPSFSDDARDEWDDLIARLSRNL